MTPDEWPRVIPLVVLDDPARVARLAGILHAAGLTTVEVALRTPASEEVLRAFAAYDGLSVIAGTVRDAAQGRRALEAGAEGFVSPGFVAGVAQVAKQAEVPYVPGVATPTEALTAQAAGLRHVKFFPADRLGGPSTLRAFTAALPGIRFMPSGGVAGETAQGYLDIPEVFAVSGSWVAPRALVEQGAWDDVAALIAASESLWGQDA